jgi:hypothetical protein
VNFDPTTTSVNSGVNIQRWHLTNHEQHLTYSDLFFGLVGIHATKKMHHLETRMHSVRGDFLGEVGILHDPLISYYCTFYINYDQSIY